ncbi:MAG: helix-turn-helix transcriptional regulator [Clostridia bacterium]|nr:helix-turn-helix transcriptional regulator [Clostridia bacterium]
MKNENLSKKEIIDRIGYFRNQRNMSAYKLGMELGHSKTYFYRVESGEIQLNIDSLLEILEVLQVSTTEFFCPTLSEDDFILLDMINGLSKENKRTIMDLIKKLK